jgi:hypothetical protein
MAVKAENAAEARERRDRAAREKVVYACVWLSLLLFSLSSQSLSVLYKKFNC